MRWNFKGDIMQKINHDNMTDAEMRAWIVRMRKRTARLKARMDGEKATGKPVEVCPEGKGEA